MRPGEDEENSVKRPGKAIWLRGDEIERRIRRSRKKDKSNKKLLRRSPPTGKVKHRPLPVIRAGVVRSQVALPAREGRSAAQQPAPKSKLGNKLGKRRRGRRLPFFSIDLVGRGFFRYRRQTMANRVVSVFLAQSNS